MSCNLSFVFKCLLVELIVQSVPDESHVPRHATPVKSPKFRVPRQVYSFDKLTD